MAGRLTPLGVFLKWVLVPVSLGAIGYFLVGPRVDGKVAKEFKDKMNQVTGGKPAEAPAEGESSEEEPEEEQPSSKFAPPEVDVTVTALNTRPTTTRKKRRKRRTPPKETTSEPSVAPPPAGGGTAEPTTPG